MTGLKSCPTWEGKAYRGESGYAHEPGETAADVVRYEEEELGNQYGIAPGMYVELGNYPATDLVWVTKQKAAARRYGVPEEVAIPEGSRIIATDEEGGYLVLKGHNPGNPGPLTPEEEERIDQILHLHYLLKPEHHEILERAQPYQHLTWAGAGTPYFPGGRRGALNLIEELLDAYPYANPERQEQILRQIARASETLKTTPELTYHVPVHRKAPPSLAEVRHVPPSVERRRITERLENPGEDIPKLRDMIIAKTYPGANPDFARVSVFPIGSPTYPGRFCLFSSNENAYFGRLKDTFQEAVEAANKENMRMYGLISKGKEHHSWSTPRALSAIATGALTGLVGCAVPVVGLAGGLLAQVLEKQNPQLLKVQYLTAGVVDGSAALIAKSLFTSIQARPMKLTLTEEELDKLEFEAAKKGEYLPPSLRPTKEQFKEILREKLLKKD